jgi:prepilin-type N-terminal cleavage/methylation domain-containing protein
MNSNKGITLVELIVVVSIIGILVVSLGFSFQGWMGAYRIESQTKEIYVDLMTARARSMQRNREHYVDFPSATSYRIREDINEDRNPAVLAGDTILPTYPKTVQYTITPALGGGVNTISFNVRGRITPDGNIRVTLPDGVAPDYDCVVFDDLRVNIGLWDGANCAAK